MGWTPRSQPLTIHNLRREYIASVSQTSFTQPSRQSLSSAEETQHALYKKREILEELSDYDYDDDDDDDYDNYELPD